MHLDSGGEVDVELALSGTDSLGSLLLATLIDANRGEWSQSHMDHGFYAQGVNVTTAVLPNGWETRTVQMAPDGPSGVSIGWCTSRSSTGGWVPPASDRDRPKSRRSGRDVHWGRWPVLRRQ